MVIYPELKKDKQWIIHILLGPESSLDFDLNGNVSFNLSEIIDQHNIDVINDKVTVQITHVMSEMRSSQILNEYVGQKKVVEKAKEIMQDMAKQHTISKIDKGDLKDGIYLEEIECPFCHRKGVYVQSGKVTACKDCIKIEEGLKKQITEYITEPIKKKRKRKKKQD